MKTRSFAPFQPARQIIAHRDLPVYGVQFHPESILTQHGKALLKNFLAL